MNIFFQENCQQKSDDENESPPSFGKLSPRKHLSSIQNLNPTSPKKPVATPPVPSLSEKFIEVSTFMPFLMNNVISMFVPNSMKDNLEKHLYECVKQGKQL